MFTWYARAKICYVYLADVAQYDPLHGHKDAGSFVGSRWFKRGWTLQELIAPQLLYFYTCDWVLIGDKQKLTRPLLAATGIRADVLTQEKSFRDCSVAQRMFWASNRKTTREEDIAYCLLGLFGVNMPLLYGESSQAFIRLQEIIIQETDDETIFAWAGVDEGGSGLLAPSPANFAQSADMELIKRHEERAIFEKTNRGLRIEVMMLPCEMNTYVVPLQCEQINRNSGAKKIAIFICKATTKNQYRRVRFDGKCMDECQNWQISRATTATIFVPKSAHNVELAPHSGLPSIRVKSNLHAWQLPKASIHRYPQESCAEWNAACSTLKDCWPRLAASEPDMIRRREVGEFAFNQPLSGSNLRNDLETQPEGTMENGSNAFGWAPKKVQNQIHFRSHNLDLGIIILFARSASREETLYYLLELGFDEDFCPTCTLVTIRTDVRGGNGPLQSVDTGLKYYWPALPVKPTFWSKDGPPYWSPRVYPKWNWDLRRPCKRWKATGNSHDGLQISIVDVLPAVFGCYNVNVALRPSKDLEWELVFEEQPIHPRALHFCKKRKFIRCRELIFYIKHSRLMHILLMGCMAMMIGGLTLSSALKSSLGAAIGLFAFLIIYPFVVTLLVLPFYSQTPTATLGHKRHSYSVKKAGTEEST